MVSGSNPLAATSIHKQSSSDQGSHSNPQAQPSTNPDQGFSLAYAIQSFLLSCRVEGKSLATIDAYGKKLKGFLWYAERNSIPDDVSLIDTQHIRLFLAWLRDTEHRFDSRVSSANRHVNSTTIQRYYRVLSNFWNWMIREEMVAANPLLKIKAPKAERKVVRALSTEQVSRLLQEFDNSLDGRRNRAFLLLLLDCGLRLGEALNLQVHDIDLEHQVLKVGGKTGERVVRYGSATAKALMKYLMARSRMDGASNRLWLTSQGQPLQTFGVESIFRRLSAKTGISVHPHLMRHTFATMWLLNGGDSLMLQRLLGHTTLTMTNRYCQAVGCLDAIESHKRYSPVDNLRFK